MFLTASLTTNKIGGNEDYLPYIYGPVKKTDNRNKPSLLDFALHNWDNVMVRPTRGTYITLSTETYDVWFTGFLSGDGDPIYLGVDNGTPRWGLAFQATGDEYILNLHPLGILPPFINQTQGQILKQLIKILAPSEFTFDTTDIDDGQILPRYVVDPNQQFHDVVTDFANAANYRFSIKALKCSFKQQDAVASPLVIDGNDKHFTPTQLSVQATKDPIINDAVVIGQLEPQNYMTEYFVGDGVTSQFPLVESVFGLDSALLLDEDYSAAQVDNTKWTVYDPAGTVLSQSGGYLNCVGGSANDSYDVSLQSANLVPIEGNLSIVHGEVDFVSLSNGIIGSLWIGPVGGGALLTANLLYGINVLTFSAASGTFVMPAAASGDATAYTLLTPWAGIGAGSDLGTQVRIDFTKRYLIRTFIKSSETVRQTGHYSTLASNGTIQRFGGSVEPNTCQIQSIITEVDPSTGNVTNQWKWLHTVAFPSNKAGAIYAPAVANDLHCALTGTTVSSPMQASLEQKASAIFKPNFSGTGATLSASFIGVTPCAGSLLCHDTTGANIQSVSSNPSLPEVWQQITLNYVANSSGAIRIHLIKPTTPGQGLLWDDITVSPTISLLNAGFELGTLSGWNLTSDNGAAFVCPISHFGSHGFYQGDGNDVLFQDIHGLTPGQTYTVSAWVFLVGTSFTLFKWTSLATGTVTLHLDSPSGVPLPGYTTTGLPAFGFLAIRTSYTIPGTRMYLTDDTTHVLLATVVLTGEATSPYLPEILGPNEIDVLDGLAPVATIVDSNNGVSSKKSLLGTTSYNPGQATLQYFKNTSLFESYAPEIGTLIALRYRQAGAAIGHVRDAASVSQEVTGWGDDGIRSVTRSDVKPVPRTSKECEAAAAALVTSNNYQRFAGTYQLPSGDWLTGEPVSGTLLKFQNLTYFPDLPAGLNNRAESISQVTTTFDHSSGLESFTHSVSFGPIDALGSVVSKFRRTDNVFAPQDTAEVPTFINVSDFGSSTAPSVTRPLLISWDASSLHFDASVSLSAGASLEVRYTDSNWGAADGNNLVVRSSTSTFTVPRTQRSRLIFIKMVTSTGLRSRHAAGIHIALPSIPTAPKGTFVFSDPLNPQVSLVLPAKLDDVWGVEIRDSAGSSVLIHYDLTDPNYLQIPPPPTTYVPNYSNPVYTIHNNTTRTPVVLGYCYNLLGEYSSPSTISGTMPSPAITSMTFDDRTKAVIVVCSHTTILVLHVTTDGLNVLPMQFDVNTSNQVAWNVPDNYFHPTATFTATPFDPLGFGPSLSVVHTYFPSAPMSALGGGVGFNNIISVPVLLTPSSDVAIPGTFSQFAAQIRQIALANYAINQGVHV